MNESIFSRVLGGLLPKHESLSDPMADRFQKTIYNESNVTTTTHQVLTGNFYGDGSDHSNMKLFSALVEGSQDKSKLIEKLERIKSYDYVETLLRDVATDVMTRNFDPTQGEFFEVRFFEEDSKLSKSDRQELEDKLNLLIDELNIYDMLLENMEECLFIGQYIFKMDLANNELDDSLNQSTILPAYKKGKMTKMYDDNEKCLRDTTNYLAFNLFSSSKKTRIKSASGDFYYLKLPRGIIPESAIQKIMNLKLLESLQPLIELQAVDEKMIFNVRFPAGKDAKEAYRECRNYERLLKSMYSLDTEQTANSVEDIIDKISQVKVIPLFGSQDTMQQQSLNKINRMELSQIEDLRKSISNSLKINISGDNAQNTEYHKLIKRIRTLLKSSLEDFIVKIAKHKYTKDIDKKDFEVIVPDVLGAEDLDAMEYMNLTQSTQKQVMDLLLDSVESIEKLSQSPLIDHEALIESMSDKISKITGSRILKTFQDVDLEAVKKRAIQNSNEEQ